MLAYAVLFISSYIEGTLYRKSRYSYQKTWKQSVDDEPMIVNNLASLKEFASRGNLSKAFEVFSRIRLDSCFNSSYDVVSDPISSLLLCCNKVKAFDMLVYLLINKWGGKGLDRIISHTHLCSEPVVKHWMWVWEGRFISELMLVMNEACLCIMHSFRCMGNLGNWRLRGGCFDEMPERDAVSWNTVISAYASECMWEEAFDLFVKMLEAGIEANIISWNTRAGGCLRTDNFKGALELLSQMRTHDANMDSVATVIGLGACSHIGAFKMGKEIHGAAIRSCCAEYDNVRNALITMYSRCKDLRHAYISFQMIEEKSIITWNSMLSGYTHTDQAEEASFFFREMLHSGIEPNYVTIASILPLCARVANLQHGKEFHCYILRRALLKDYLLLWNALIEMYARSGKVVNAKRVFDLLSRRDEVTYTSLIAGYGIQGEGQVALKLFGEMNKYHIKPDHVTMVAVLSACSHSGLVVDGQMLFEKMPRVYGIFPQLEHYACMVDLYGRAGLLNKAKEIITKMPYIPTSAMWATLLGACRIHGNTDIGEWAAEKLLETRPENSGYYVLIANSYAAAGCWNKLAKVRTFMRNLGVRKAPGCAWVDMGTGFSPFLVGDTSNVQTQGVYPLLDGLNGLMKDAGCVARGEFCSEDEVLEEIG